ncbi:aromatic ring-hydroxylating dioxygenase subunit alpha [Paraburkholderia oxyphila]|uniref:aromatic ring-hydroxylating dioxygenase subunit alpha n=1 Tax=Paraburkholderia oxyphila TaxID=614212 RepID=UPI00048284CE|nr:aromatic ring-hydroxylating dioxygenase subunit alpha [Paraburkholderia oxyphila]
MSTPSKKEWLLNPSRQPYPRNQWYVAALSTEVGRTPLGRKILGTDVVLYRTTDGMPIALYDRCPHRSLPLSMGELVGDEIQCAYHGMRFDTQGACVAIPGQCTISGALLHARSYPLVEKSLWIWIWMGDAERADPALIPDHHYLHLDGPAFRPEPLFSMQIDCNFQLCHENLVDLTHLTYLHKGAFETGGVDIVDTTSRLDFGENSVRLTYTYRNLLVEPTYAAISGFAAGTRINRTLVTETLVPSLCLICNTYTSPDDPAAPPKIWSTPFAMTPRNTRSTNYFFVSSANYDLVYTDEAKAQIYETFMQDKVALERIQQVFDESDPDFEYEFSVKADAGALRVRRMIQAMALAERSDAASGR